MDYKAQMNALPLYLLVGGILLFILICCGVFLIRSYRAGVAIGMDRKVLKKTMTTSAVFTILPSVGILVGVVTLSGTLGIPLAWMRLSVVGALQYELSVAEIAAEAIGLSGLRVSEMSMGAYTTISLVMTVGILGGGLCSIFFLGRYLKRVYRRPKKAEQPGEKKSDFGAVAMAAMFIGLCTAYISSYIGRVANFGDYMPLFTAGCAGVIMVFFELLGRKARFRWLDSFNVALSMLLAMGLAVVLKTMV